MTNNQARERGADDEQGLPDDVLDAATAPPQQGSGGPTDANDLGRAHRTPDDLSGRDAAQEGIGRDAGAANSGTDIGSGSGR